MKLILILSYWRYCNIYKKYKSILKEKEEKSRNEIYGK